MDAGGQALGRGDFALQPSEGSVIDQQARRLEVERPAVYKGPHSIEMAERPDPVLIAEASAMDERRAIMSLIGIAAAP